MKGEQCSNCGYHLTFGEAAEIFGRVDGRTLEALGINKYLNMTNVKCPRCGSVECWKCEDEKLVVQ